MTTELKNSFLFYVTFRIRILYCLLRLNFLKLIFICWRQQVEMSFLNKFKICKFHYKMFLMFQFKMNS